MPKFNIVLDPKMLWATPGSLGPLLLMRIKWRRKSWPRQSFLVDSSKKTRVIVS